MPTTKKLSPCRFRVTDVGFRALGFQDFGFRVFRALGFNPPGVFDGTLNFKLDR